MILYLDLINIYTKNKKIPKLGKWKIKGLNPIAIPPSSNEATLHSSLHSKMFQNAPNILQKMIKSIKTFICQVNR